MISLLRRRPKTTVGLDIGSGFVKAAVISHAGSEPELSKVAYLPLVADAIVEGEIMDPTLVADTVRAHPDAGAIVLEKHGTITWGATVREASPLTLEEATLALLSRKEHDDAR